MTTFFSHINLSMYLLHEPTFRRDISEGLHLRHPRFGALLLMVCAVAARHSNDPRVYLEGSDSTLSSGWKWFDQVQILPKYMFDTPRTYELQIYCVGLVTRSCQQLSHAASCSLACSLVLSGDIPSPRFTDNDWLGPTSLSRAWGASQEAGWLQTNFSRRIAEARLLVSPQRLSR